MIAHREVLLYAQSGAGKTSLLNAGVIPLLIEEGFEMLPVARVRGLIPEGVDLKAIVNIYAFNTQMAWVADRVDPRAMTSTSMAAFLGGRGHPTDAQGVPLPRVAIFDQFEELFAFYAERWREREAFFLQVAEALEADPLLRVLFVLREDYVASLDPHADLLPEGLRTRYRLERLRSEAACLAVEGPLRGTGRSFAEGVAASLVQELVGIRLESAAGEVVEAAGEYVEPVQLQVVCQNLWLELPPETTLITTEHLRTFGDVNEALRVFYERAVSRVAGETGVNESDLRRWFDHQLITAAGTRGTVFRGRDSTGGIPNAAVDALENRHLIRAELRAGARWYELTHDRFIEPIQRSNAAWRQHERAEAQQRQLEAERQRAAEQQRRAEEQTRAARRLRRLSAALVVASLLAVGAAGLAVWGWKAAEAERDRAEQQATLAASRAAEAEKARAEAVDAQRMAEEERTRAEQKARLATARELAAAATDNLTRDPERSVLLARQAVSETYTVDKTVILEAEDALHRALQAARVQLTLAGHTDRLFGVAFSPDGTQLATASADRTVKVWDAATSQELRTLAGHAGAVGGVAFSPDGKHLATTSLDSTVKVWDMASGQEVRTLSDHLGEVDGVAFSPDGTLIATAGGDLMVRVWNAHAGQKLLTLSGHDNGIISLAFSPEGRRLATASADKTARVWDVATGEVLLTLAGHTDMVYGAIFSPDGAWLATASRDGTARVWNAATGQEMFKLSDHRGWVMGIAFSPDGRRLATASFDHTVKVWDAATGKALLTLFGHTDTVYGVAFSADGTHLATAGGDRTAKVWDAATGQVLLTLPAIPRGSTAWPSARTGDTWRQRAQIARPACTP
jgi:DNA-binding beta-propeller fold protein YncE